MPSFRASVAVTALRPNTDPAAVMETAKRAVARHGVVEDSFIDIDARAGLPRITVRFAVEPSNDAEEDAQAWRTGRELCAAVGGVASWTRLEVRRRIKGRWALLPPS